MSGCADSRRCRFLYQPGERWLYNTGADVLGVLIARAAGQSLDEFLRGHVFEPLGMVDTGFSVGDIDRFAGHDVAHVHVVQRPQRVDRGKLRERLGQRRRDPGAAS